jgi:hypothetical protein
MFCRNIDLARLSRGIPAFFVAANEDTAATDAL